MPPVNTNKDNLIENIIDRQGNEWIASLKKQGDKSINKYSNHREQSSYSTHFTVQESHRLANMEAHFWVRTTASGVVKGLWLNPQDTLGRFQDNQNFSEEE